MAGHPLSTSSGTMGGAENSTILCVDDEVIGLEIRRVVLEREGYRVLTAAGGKKGLDIFDAHAVDAVVLDYSMPDMNGGEVAAHMRAKKPSVPILLLSAFVSLPSEVLEMVDSFLVKGEGASKLIDRLHELLASKRQTMGGGDAQA